MFIQLKTKINKLAIPEKTGNKIGLFRVLCSIFGGLIVSYLAMTLLVYIIPGTAGESIVVPLLFNTLGWAVAALWISVAPTKLSALKRSFYPTIIFSILLTIFYNI